MNNSFSLLFYIKKCKVDSSGRANIYLRITMDGHVQVNEFVLGGYEQGKIGRSYSSKKKKAIAAAEFTDDGKVKVCML